MIGNTLKKIVFDFFLHIEVNTLNLPYKNLPKPYTTNKISKLFRAIFELSWIHKLFGLNLATAMLLVPISSQITSIPEQEPPVVVTRTDLVSSYLPSDPAIVTVEREYKIPVDNLKYIAQKYHPGHYAYDLNADVGSAVRAFSNGRVHYIEDGIFGYGRHIVIDHGHELFSLYAHLKTFDVEVGDVVKAGDKIGEVGMTGYTTGPHLHFEVHDSNKPVNPSEYLNLPN